jgi:hypothetical protein
MSDARLFFSVYASNPPPIVERGPHTTTTTTIAVTTSPNKQMDDSEVISFLLQTEIIPLCLRIMETGNELSKTVRIRQDRGFFSVWVDRRSAARFVVSPSRRPDD